LFASVDPLEVVVTSASPDTTVPSAVASIAKAEPDGRDVKMTVGVNVTAAVVDVENRSV
jgi:hypothetical protein